MRASQHAKSQGTHIIRVKANAVKDREHSQQSQLMKKNSPAKMLAVKGIKSRNMANASGL